MDLFEPVRRPQPVAEPLAARMRPRTLDDVLGQDAILGPGRLLRRAIEADRLTSIILFGPPGCGKTSVAEAIAQVTRRAFARASGVLANVAVLRELIRKSEYEQHAQGRQTILFIDEIHRFNKAQQDVLLPHVERGTITLIGATTHNPQFFINGPLVSRSLVFELVPLTEAAIIRLLERALVDPRGLADHPVDAEAKALAHLARVCDGDARRALNALEIAVLTTPVGPDGRIALSVEVAEASVQRKQVLYDHDEDGHYDTISAMIKSIRGSDPHAASYWLAKMLVAGEDPRFIARRLVILASEDVGNADPRALTLAVSAMHASEFVGMPEARIILSQAATYLATAPKSNAAYVAIEKAWADVEQARTLPVPRHLRNKKPRTDNERPEAEAPYRYPHDFTGHHVDQEYLPTSAVYYEPSDEGYEAIIRKRMEAWRVSRVKGAGNDG